MSIRRYVAVTNREALAQVRRELGEDAVILSNKRIAGGRVEIVAAAPEAMEALVQDARASRSGARAAGDAGGRSAGRQARQAAPVRTVAPMPGESFQQFVRRQSEASARRSEGPAPNPARAVEAAVPTRQAAAAMYSAVAATAPVDETGDAPADAEWTTAAQPWTGSNDGWSPPAWAAEALARSGPGAGGSSSRAAATGSSAAGGVPQPRAAVAAPGSTAATRSPQGGAPADPAPPRAGERPASSAAPPAAEPAVFRRRPSREAQGAGLASSSVRPTATVAAPGARVTDAAAPRSDAAAGSSATAAPAAAVESGPAVGTEPPSSPQGPRPAGLQPTNAVAPSANRTAGIDAAPAPVASTDGGADSRLLAELQSLRAALHEQWVTLSSSVAAADVQRRHPLQARLMTRLLTSGFTPEVARRIALHAPENIDATGLDTWLQDVLTVNLRCVSETDAIVERGGVYALVGPTGVGKTTTAAKLAARFAVRYGTSALGLITLDAYRIAAHEQLRAYGRILGVPVHLAQDGATLRELLASMGARRLVLIDTCGVGPRDARLAEMLGTLAQADTAARRVQPVLLLNAASHAESLEEMARAWRSQEAAGCILTKLDEAARIGGALDCAMRHKLTVLALTNGQRVPEDLHLPNARLLAHLALKPAGPLFALDDHEGAVVAHAPAAPRAAAHAH